MSRAWIAWAVLASACGGCGADLGTDDGVRGAYQRATGYELGEGCIERPVELPGVVLVGGFAQDRGCVGTGAFIDGELVEWPDATRAGLAHLGFRAAGPARRREIASAWVRRAIYAYEGGLAETATDAFGREDTPAFVAPTVETAGDEVVIRGWSRAPSGMVDEDAYTFVEHRFASDGTLRTRELAAFVVPGGAL